MLVLRLCGDRRRKVPDDDGFSDILFQNTSGQAMIWEMNGTNVIGGDRKWD